jgi:hypothetical protein
MIYSKKLNRLDFVWKHDMMSSLLFRKLGNLLYFFSEVFISVGNQQSQTKCQIEMVHACISITTYDYIIHGTAGCRAEGPLTGQSRGTQQADLYASRGLRITDAYEPC